MLRFAARLPILAERSRWTRPRLPRPYRPLHGIHTRSQSGYTLVEVLVVILVVGRGSGACRSSGTW